MSCGGREARQGKRALCLERSLALPTTLDVFVLPKADSFSLVSEMLVGAKGIPSQILGSWGNKAMEEPGGKLAAGSNLL